MEEGQADFELANAEVKKYSWNPFSEVTFTGIKESSFLKKCQDTFFIFVGTFHIKQAPSQQGILSLLTIAVGSLLVAPFAIFVGPLLYLERQRRQSEEKAEYSVWAWVIAILDVSDDIIFHGREGPRNQLTEDQSAAMFKDIDDFDDQFLSYVDNVSPPSDSTDKKSLEKK